MMTEEEIAAVRAQVDDARLRRHEHVLALREGFDPVAYIKGHPNLVRVQVTFPETAQVEGCVRGQAIEHLAPIHLELSLEAARALLGPA